MFNKCHICGCDCEHIKFTYLVNYPLGLTELNFCSEEHRDEYIKKHIAEYYRGVPIYQQFNYYGDRTAYMLNPLEDECALNIQVLRDYIDEIIDEIIKEKEL